MPFKFTDELGFIVVLNQLHCVEQTINRALARLQHTTTTPLQDSFEFEISLVSIVLPFIQSAGPMPFDTLRAQNLRWWLMKESLEVARQCQIEPIVLHRPVKD